MTHFVALLRGINVGKTKLPMAELRPLCESLGWRAVRTYIQSGNVVFESGEKPAALEAALEAGVAGAFPFAVPVMVRSAAQWRSYLAANPFPEVAEAEANRLMLCVSKRPPDGAAADALQERARDGERVRLSGGAIWVHYPAGAGTSRLSPAMFDRLAGSPVTARNWRTALRIGAMLDGEA